MYDKKIDNTYIQKGQLKGAKGLETHHTLQFCLQNLCQSPPNTPPQSP